MDNIPEASENRFATLADLQELLNIVQTKLARFNTTNNLEQRNHHVEEPNGDIQSLCQEVVRLREANIGRKVLR